MSIILPGVLAFEERPMLYQKFNMLRLPWLGEERMGVWSWGGSGGGGALPFWRCGVCRDVKTPIFSTAVTQ